MCFTPSLVSHTRGFKALKRIIKLFFKLGKHTSVTKRFGELLKEYASLLMENEKAINSLLEFIATTPDIKELYNMALAQLTKNGNKVSCS